MPVRFSEPIRQAKAAYEDGAIGALHAIVGTNLLQKMAADTWFTDPERSGGEAIMDRSVHVVDLARWITGLWATEGVLEVDCFGQTHTRTRDGGDGRGIDSVFWGTDINVGLIRDFVAAVRGGTTPEIPRSEGAREVRVVEAPYESAERGEPVRIEYE